MSAIQCTSDNIVTPPSLALSTTYYFGIGGDASLVGSVHLKWDAAVIVTFTIETSNFDDVALNSTTAGDWIQENPTGGYVGSVGAGVTVTALTIAVAGGAAGGAMVHFGNIGSKRMRLKVVIGGTGGVVRAKYHGKA